MPKSYDPEFGDWEFGKLSALREIALCIENDYQYYYMGKALLAVRALNHIRLQSY
jgi:arginyl-tRNA--protein-N-Asp/Glu arginylyltransferase